jgi:hypothetical protein
VRYPHRGISRPLADNVTISEGLLTALAGSANTVCLRDFRCEYRTGDPRSQRDVPAGPFSFADSTIVTAGTGLVVGLGTPAFAAGAPRGALAIQTAGWCPNAVAVGAGFKLPRMETIHPQLHDVPMGVIVTERRTMRLDAVAGGHEGVDR